MVKIATATSRLAKKWRNKEMSWQDFMARLGQPTITQESFAEYQKMSKADRARVKDVGGFVGGWLRSGKRRIGHVQLRSLLTLDIDQANLDLLDAIELLFDWEGFAYSTHSHTKDLPRYRLIFPLSREVSADEYQAIARYVAKKIGMEQFDPTSFQPERLMYWPSHARDGDFTAHHFKGEWLPVDTVLDSYPNWTDVTFWPLHPLESEAHIASGEMMEDPREKKGWIGAFCRTYSMTDAIHHFLGEVYADGSKEDRFTYLDGTTSDGLVVYSDMYAYSHHSSDPVNGKTVNAFDLVRLHLFGDLDEKQKEDISPTKLKSYKNMIQLVEADEAVNKEMNQTILGEAAQDFEGLEVLPDKVDEPKKQPPFRLNQEGDLVRDPYNLEIILEYSAEFQGSLGYNDFMDSFEKLKKMPWDSHFNPYWTDADTAMLKSYINSEYKLLFGDDRILDSLIVVGKNRPFNPVKQYISKETWDKTPRISQIFVDYLGAENTSYVREVTELWMAAAVSRIFNPGCKFDTVPVLEGAQGIGKSTLIHKLGGDWFTDGLQKLDGNKDDLQLLSQSWIVELSELASMSRTHIDQAKGFISRTVDSYRPPYGRMTINQKRHVVFIGTTNNAEFLKDATGNRRWYPITCRKGKQTKSVFDGSLEEVLPQLWAEAYELYRTKYKFGHHLVLSNANEEVANEARRAAEAPDVTKDLVIEYLNQPKPRDWQEMTTVDKMSYLQGLESDSILEGVEDKDLAPQNFVSSREIYEVKFASSSYYSTKTSAANAEIRKIGMVLSGLTEWEPTRQRVKGELMRGYARVKAKKAEILEFKS